MVLIDFLDWIIMLGGLHLRKSDGTCGVHDIHSTAGPLQVWAGLAEAPQSQKGAYNLTSGGCLLEE